MLRPILFAGMLLVLCPVVLAAPSSTGQTGLVHMPDGRLNADGDWLFGVSHARPYATFWSTITILPWLEVTGRYTRVDDLQGFATGGGRYKDKAFDAKLRILEESEWLPALAFGIQDFHGDAVQFRARYLAASKRLDIAGGGALDLTVGYGWDRLDGLYGGLRWTTPWSDRFRVLLERDATDYPNDMHTVRAGYQRRAGGFTQGVEYDFGWVTAQLNHQRGEWGANLSLRVPLQQREFIPKSDEPPAAPAPARVASTLEEWVADPATLAPVYRRLAADGVTGVRLRVEGPEVHVAFSQRRMSMVGRAAGRAARIISLGAPPDATALELTFFEYGIPMVTFRFEDMALLRAYFEGDARGEALSPTLSIRYVDSAQARSLRAEGVDWEEVFPGLRDGRVIVSRAPLLAGGALNAYWNTPTSGLFRFQPLRFGTYFNDSVGAFKWDVYSVAEYQRWFGDNFFAVVAGRITLWENVSDVQIRSTSEVPRVRSDIGEYARNTKRLGLLRAYSGHIGNPADRVYTMVTAGWYEQMFAGAGGEVLYLPETGNWAADLRVYGVQQREFDGGFGFRDYRAVTALASFYYRLPIQGVTITARAGQFLAKDQGVRLEVKRRFRSNFEAGGWYTWTDANDLCAFCGGRPYRDKGVFLRVAFGSVLTSDSSAAADFSLQPWTRDPGAMLRAPGNLYDMFERRLHLNMAEWSPWSDFGL